MSKNKKSSFDSSHLSVWHVLDSANAYYEMSLVFTSQVPETLAEIARSTARYDLVAASATNRMLALELYFKAVYVAARLPVPKEHDFEVLFDSLPTHHRKAIESRYDELVERIPKVGTAWGLEIVFGVGDTVISDAEIKKQVPYVKFDPSLPSLLKRNRDGFVASRYLFALAKPGKITVFQYEHRQLALLCSVLCEALENSLDRTQLSYKRNFQFQY